MKYTPSYLRDILKASQSIPDKEEFYGKHILITGGTGLVCSSVADILLMMNREYNAGIDIVIASRNEAGVRERFEGFGEQDGLKFFSYDAMDTERIDYPEELDYIIHGASNANPAIYAKEPVETMMANITGLSGMLQLARDKQAKMLYVSSSEIYGIKDGMEPLKEQDYGYLDILSERAGYPSSKRAGESLVVAYGKEYGTNAVIVRPGHIYGPAIKDSDNRATAEFTRNALDHENIMMRSKGTQLRSYCYSLDCASGMLTALLKGETGTAYNISDPDAICTISDIAHEIADQAGVEVRYQMESEEAGKAYSPMTNASLDSTRLESLGWRPAFGLKGGVASLLGALIEQ